MDRRREVGLGNVLKVDEVGNKFWLLVGFFM